MTIKNSQTFSNIIFQIIILTDIYALAWITCPKEILFQIGLNTKCESPNGMVIPCDGSHTQPVKKAYIDCTDGYFNGGQEVLECNFNTGKWSKEPVRCFSGCHTARDGNNLINNKIEIVTNPSERPLWYAEILKRPPINGEVNVYPGIIFRERLIMTWEKFFDPKKKWNLVNYVVRVYRPESVQDYTIDHIEYISSDPVNQFDRTPELDAPCMLVLTHDNYIKIDDIVVPTCLDYGIRLFIENRWFIETMIAKPEYKLRPEYKPECLVPHVENHKIELLCYSSINSNPLRRCPSTVPVLQTRCQIGYEKVNSNNDDVVSMCVGSRWNVDYEGNNDCKLMCGEIGGNSAAILQPLIFNGRPSDIKDAPWHVGIYSNNTIRSTSHELICSGSIIHKNIVISAAHCFYNQALRRTDDVSHYLVGAGKRSYSYKMSENAEQFVRIAEINVLRTYDTIQLRNDLAVLIVNPDFIFTPYVKPVCLDWASYFDYDLENGTKGYIFGWGATSAEDVLSKNLSTVDLNALKSDQCKLINDKADVTGENFCGINDGGATACKGDSGGGFVVKRKIGNSERYALWGIISSGVANDYCSSGGVTIFTNIQYFQDPIKAIISRSRKNLNTKNLSKILWHRIYAHDIWTPLYWVKQELKLDMKTKDPS